MECLGRPIGVCSWSLRLDINEVTEALNKIGIDYIHLGLRWILDRNSQDSISLIKKQPWNISATMIDFPQEDYSTLDSIKQTGGIVPDEYWERNRQLFFDAIEVTKALGVNYLSMHAGFIDETKKEYAEKFHNRIRILADAAASENITLLLETGQETAVHLKNFLEKINHPGIGVNFDPANMILYDMGDPIEAVKILAPWIKHIHIKDALGTTNPGTWGQEVVWGDGQVQSDKFLHALEKINYQGVLAIEREAGDNRLEDIQLAARRLNSFKG
jgi:L-ribulose-5-phosphate 3-epimerase